MPRPRKIRPVLTKAIIDAAAPGAKDHFLYDHLEHGLAVKVTPAGSKVFILNKSVCGKLTRITIGAYGDWTLDDARKKARQQNGLIADGRDPVAEGKARRAEAELRARSEKTVSELWDRYWVDAVEGHNKPTTAREKLRMWNSRIKPALGKIKIKDVTDEDVGAVVRSPLRFDEKGHQIGGNGEGASLYRLLHHMFGKAALWKLRSRDLGNPLEGVQEPKVRRRERLLSEKEVAALRKEIAAAREAKAEQPQVLAAIDCAMLTGARISEILTLRWDSVRIEERELRLADTKSGFSVRPISKEALTVLKGVGRLPGSPFVFRSVENARDSLSYNTVEKAFKRIVERAGITNCSLHTIRHWYVTQTANNVSNPRVGMRLTGHKSHAAYMTYVHSEMDQAHELAGKLASKVIQLETAADGVVSLPKKSQFRKNLAGN